MEKLKSMLDKLYAEIYHQLYYSDVVSYNYVVYLGTEEQLKELYKKLLIIKYALNK